MYELINAAGNTYYIKSPTNVGLYKTGEGEAILIDGGSDKSAGRKIRQTLDANGWRLKAILNTHCHADHIGGNRYLQNQTGCGVYLPESMVGFAENPILNPSVVYGAYPDKELRHKFLLAQPSSARPLGEFDLPEGFEVIDLPGHSYSMVGFRTPDNVVFLADGLASENTLKKYQISFLYNVEDYLKSLEKIKGLKADLFIPSHGPAQASVRDLAQKNIDKTYEVSREILKVCRSPINFDRILKFLFDRYGLEINREQHALIGHTLRSYLSWLVDSGKLGTEFSDNVLYFKAL